MPYECPADLPGATSSCHVKQSDVVSEPQFLGDAPKWAAGIGLVICAFDEQVRPAAASFGEGQSGRRATDDHADGRAQDEGEGRRVP
jgi:hypothetical protein